MAVTSQTQKRNADLVALLRTDFLHLTDPARTLRIATTSAVVGDPPLKAEIDTVVTVAPTALPANVILIIDVTDTDKHWLVVGDEASNEWWLLDMTKAA